jgi:hypothetical protein
MTDLTDRLFARAASAAGRLRMGGIGGGRRGRRRSREDGMATLAASCERSPSRGNMDGGNMGGPPMPHTRGQLIRCEQAGMPILSTKVSPYGLRMDGIGRYRPRRPAPNRMMDFGCGYPARRG